MDFKSLVKNTSVAFLAQGVAMVVSILTTLFVPKLLGVEEYGYWQLFIFYASYVGFGHLGLNDGVYLINGGKPRKSIDKSAIISQMLVSLVFQSVISIVILAAVSNLNLGAQRDFVVTATAIYMLIQNTALYLGYVFQAMNETILYSRSAIIERVGFAIPMLLLLALGVDSFEPYVYAYCFSSILQLLYCCWHARDFFASGLVPPTEAVRLSVKSVRVGIKLMLANIASQLILGVARMVIDAVWGIKTFGELSLSLSMVNFFLAFISQASMVLFPALRQSRSEDQRKFYHVARDAMSILFPVAYLLYFPMRWLIGAWLPAYAESLAFFAYLMPICVFDSKMNITCTTLFKVRREESTLFAINLITTAFSAAGSLIGGFVVHTFYVVLGAATVAIIGRSLFSEALLSKRLGVGSGAVTTISELVLTMGFLIIAELTEASAWGAIAYFMLYGLFLLFNREKTRTVIRQVISISHR